MSNSEKDQGKDSFKNCPFKEMFPYSDLTYALVSLYFSSVILPALHHTVPYWSVRTKSQCLAVILAAHCCQFTVPPAPAKQKL